jgi:xylulokinase
MSLLGIDVGSSSIKIVAYSEDGKTLGTYRTELEPRHPVPGSWEQDPEQVWQATCTGMRSLASKQAVKRDPPKAIAVSASARENFPVASNGKSLGPCIMGGDLRGAEFETAPEGAPWPENWTLSCGHLRERQDPALRLLWRQKNQPRVMEKAAFFIGWHEFIALRMCGRAVTDPSIASRWMTYDLKARGWDFKRAEQYSIQKKFLPEIMPWGKVIGRIKPALAKDWGIPSTMDVAVGAIDLMCAGMGAGAISPGTACICAGSFENLLIPTSSYPTASLLLNGPSVSPYPGDSGLAIIAVSPTGTMVFNWARNVLGVSLDKLEQEIVDSGLSPGPVIAVPYLSGSQLYWKDRRKLRGTLLGLTLATSRLDIIKAFMECIAYEHVMTMKVLKDEGVRIKRFRAAGGGARSRWWTQLKADVLGVPIEVTKNEEPGTIGAAMLAGLAVGAYKNLEEAAAGFEEKTTLYKPDNNRAALHKSRIEAYHESVAGLAETIYGKDFCQ